MSAAHLIFGCATLSHGRSDDEALELLHAATDLGIGHFDTARAYGAGESERLLGCFLRGRRDQVTVTTKYGLTPAITREPFRRIHDLAAARSGTRPLALSMRGLRKAVRGSELVPAKVRAGVEASLRALGTDYVDYLLLHEVTGSRARDPEIVSVLRQLTSEGKIREFGIGSEFTKLGAQVSRLPADYTVLQFEHGPLTHSDLAAALATGRTVFTHSALLGLGRVTRALQRDPPRVRRFAEELDVDVMSPEVLPGLLLAYSNSHNPEGKVIFSTRSLEHLRSNVRSFGEFRAWSPARLQILRRLFDDLPSIEAVV